MFLFRGEGVLDCVEGAWFGGATVPTAYLFEAKGIQRWLLEGGKLRDIAAGSALLSWLARGDGRDLLGLIMAQTGFPAEASRRAGGAFMLHFGDGTADLAAFARFRASWRLTVMRLAPGLEFAEALGHGATDSAAREAAFQPAARLSPTREGGPATLLPLGHSLTALAGRTGRPVTVRSSTLDPDGQGLDTVLAARRRASQAMARGAGGFGDRTAEILAAAHPGRTLLWPNRMEDEPGVEGVTFPFDDEEARIAVVHADISALGDYYARLGDAVSADLSVARKASDAIERAVAAAATDAARLLEPTASGVMPARPVLIGGDDVTLIVRADMALPFTEAFLTALEARSKEELGAFCRETGSKEDSFGGPLTAAAGVAIGGPKQPFFRLLELAESLCGFAKREAKARAGLGVTPRSVLSFHRVTESALSATASELFDRLTVHGTGRLTAQPYAVGTAGKGDFPTLGQLRALKEALEAETLRPGGLRAIRGQLQMGQRDLAEIAWGRWRQMAHGRSGNGPVAADEPRSGPLSDFDKALEALGGEGLGSTTLGGLFAGKLSPGATPLFDALEWRALS